MKNILIILILLICGLQSNAQSKLRVNVQFTVILNPSDGSFPQNTSEASFDTAIVFMNRKMVEFRRPIEFVKLPTQTIGGTGTYISSVFFNTGSSNPGSLRDSLETFAEANPTLYGWKENAINYYLNDGNGGGCSFPEDSEIILIGQTNVNNNITYLHEIGHFFGLFHTHQGQGGSCNGDPGDDDEADDTLPDRYASYTNSAGNNVACWNNIDFVSQYSYNKDFDQLTSSSRIKLVEETYFNIMSYHGNTRSKLTERQLDLWLQTLSISPSRQDVVSGIAYFVDDDDNTPCNLSGPSPCGCDGNAYVPFEGVDCAIDAINNNGGDVIIVKSGTFDVSANVISTKTLLTASRDGDAILK